MAGFPIILSYLKSYPETGRLSIPLVWKGILMALLGEPHTNMRARFETTLDERFDAACRAAAVLTLTRQDTIRGYSPDPDMTTTGTLFRNPTNRLLTAAWESCHSAAFQHLPEHGAFRFAQRNVQDWLTAFAIERLPLPALRSALIGPSGGLIPRLREPARLILATTAREDVRAEINHLSGGIILPSDASEPTLAEAIRCLDLLEELARDAPWGLRMGSDWNDDLGRLRVDGLGRVLAERLRDSARPRQVKQLLFAVADATRSMEAVETAVELVLDGTQHEQVRYRAMQFVTLFGGKDHLRQLQEPIAAGNEGTNVELQIRAKLIDELLGRGMWPIWRAALYIPPMETNLLHARASVLERVTNLMTIDDARHLLPHLGTLSCRHILEDMPYCFPDFISRAIELLITQELTQPADIDSLIMFALDLVRHDDKWPLARDLAGRLRKYPAARKRFYEYDLEAVRFGRNDCLIGAGGLLEIADWMWLRDQALGPWTGSSEVWDDVYRLARKSRDEGCLPASNWQEFVSLVERIMPGLPAQYEERIRQHEQEREKVLAKRRDHEQRDMKQLSSAERLQQILDRSDLSAGDRMRSMGYLVSAIWWAHGARVVVAEGELPEELWRRVLEVFLLGLDANEASIKPEAEGTAFSHVACSPNYASHLTSSLIRRWLPVALCAHISSDRAAVIRACWRVSQPATEQAIVEAVANQMKRSEWTVLLSSIPSECWLDALIQQVIALIREDAIDPRARRELLERLASHCPEQANNIATEWATRAFETSDIDQLREGGRNALLVLSPSAALDLIESDYVARGVAALEELHVLWGRSDELRTPWKKWPTHLLERLGRLLLRGFPPADDPEFSDGFVPPSQELRELRWQLLAHLMYQQDSEQQEAMDRLAEMAPSVREWVANHRASEQAGQLLPKVNPATARDSDALSVAEAVALLDRERYRLIRSADDLLDAVLESLCQVQAHAGQDLPMLYGAPDRSSGEKQARKHLEEDALQAYLRRLLLEILPRIVDGVDVQIVREDQVARRQRFDLRVTAPCHGSRKLLTIVIEVKWSTNNETRSGLVSQLGDSYLRGEGLTHGIFLVGWSGEWRPGDGSGANIDVGELEKFLTTQRDDYCRVGQPGAGLRIEPFVLDIHW